MHERDELKERKEADIRLSRQDNDEEFRIKSKAKKAKEIELKCESEDCLNTNEDALIKCNACGKWICEVCSDARITKLKPIMNHCNTVYFACKRCVSASKETGITVIKNLSNDVPEEGPDNSSDTDLLSSLKKVLDEKVLEIEKKVGSMIESKLKENAPETVTAESESKSGNQSYAAQVLKVPDEVRKIIQDSRNNEKVEENEQERRSRNFVIHMGIHPIKSRNLTQTTWWNYSSTSASSKHLRLLPVLEMQQQRKDQ